MKSARLVSASLFLLGGCTSAGDYPSLSPRSIEKISTAPVAAAPVAVAAPDAALRARAEAYLAQAQDGARAFDRALPVACAAAARGAGAAPGSEAWLDYQQALSAAGAARGPTGNALADLDALIFEQAKLADANGAPVDLAPVIAVQEKVAAIDAAQRTANAALAAGRCAR